MEMAVPPRPPNWEENLNDTIMDVSNYKLYPVDATSTEFQVISQLVAPCSIVTAEQIVNPDLWNRYCTHRKEMLRCKSDDMELLTNLGFDEKEVLQRCHLNANFDRDPLLETKAGKYSTNEALLFHCTKDPANVDNILRQGLDERLGNGGNFGKGIYFADDSRKSIVYDGTIAADATMGGTSGTIFIFSVLLGDCKYLQYQVRTQVVAPTYHGGLNAREPEKVDKQKRNSSDQFFDSVVASIDHGGFNEYVIFNRLQCCPLYKIKYDYQYPTSRPRKQTKKVGNVPTIAWNPMPNQSRDEDWQFFAASVFKQMSPHPTQQPTMPTENGGGDSISLTLIPTEEEIKEKIATLALLTGHDDEVELRATLENYDYKLEPAINFLLDTDRPSTASSQQPPSNSAILGEATPAKRPAMTMEGCRFCCEEYGALSHSPDLWKVLTCGHQLCLPCCEEIETKGSTMSGIEHTSIKCPFCQGITGILVGNCPNGIMDMTCDETSCEGYADYFSHTINFCLNVGGQEYRATTYLPATSEGTKILDLINTAWDRRLVFRIDSTNGAYSIPVWNIPNKTNRTGGALAHGYPDPGYLERVKQELKAFGIE